MITSAPRLFSRTDDAGKALCIRSNESRTLAEATGFFRSEEEAMILIDMVCVDESSAIAASNGRG
jgi:hypothetical protein